MLIGITGKIGSGKTTATVILAHRLKARRFRLAGYLEKMLDILSLEHSRFNYQNLGKALRTVLGSKIIIETAARELAKIKSKYIIIEDLRIKHELEFLRKEKGKLIYVDAPLKIRYQRLRVRVKHGKIGDKGKSLRAFKKEDSRLSEREIGSLKNKADFVIDNSGELENLTEQIMVIVKKLR